MGTWMHRAAAAPGTLGEILGGSERWRELLTQAGDAEVRDDVPARLWELVLQDGGEPACALRLNCLATLGGGTDPSVRFTLLSFTGDHLRSVFQEAPAEWVVQSLRPLTTQYLRAITVPVTENNADEVLLHLDTLLTAAVVMLGLHTLAPGDAP